MIGHGGSGEVYLCSYKNAPDTKFEYALKKMSITKDDDIDAANYREPRFFYTLKSINFILGYHANFLVFSQGG